MPRPNWKTASAIVQRTIRGWLADDRPAAEVWLDAAISAKSHGYDYDPPNTPHLAELEKLKKLKSPSDLLARAEYSRTYALSISAEERARAWWDSTRAWAKTDPKPTKVLADERKRRAVELEERVQARADELLVLANTGGARALLPADALEQARKELGHVPA